MDNGDDDRISPEMLAEHQRQAQNSRAYQIWSYSETGHELSVEEQMFVRSYIIDRNEVAAMRRIGYIEESAPTLKRRAQRMLASPEVQDAIKVHCKRMCDALEIDAQKVMEKVAEIAFFDPGEVMEFDHNGIKMMHSKYWTPGQRANVTGIKLTKEGVDIKLADRQKALDFLGKQLNLIDDPNSTKEAAAAAAEAAMGKIFDVVGRLNPRLAKPEEGAERPSSVN